MKKIFLILMILSTSILADYKKWLEVRDVPFQEASMLSNFSEYKNIAFHARGISKAEIKSFFNESLTKDGFVPILVTITNNSRGKVVVYGTFLKLDGVKHIGINPLLAKYQVGRWEGLKTAVAFLSLGMSKVMPGAELQEAESQGYDEARRNNFSNKSLPTELLYPGDTIRGFVFFDKKSFNKNGSLQVPIQFMNTTIKEKVSLNIQ